MTDISDNDELPTGWESGHTSDGRVFYINHQTQKTQWEHPITKKVKILPKGLPDDYKSPCRFPSFRIR